MSVELTSKQVKCRKKHRCDWCGEVIEASYEAHYRTGIHDGEFFTEYMHPECWDALGKSDLGYDDNYYPRDQQRGKTYDESHA